MQRSLDTGWFDYQSNPLVLINIRKRRDSGTNGGRVVSASFSIIDIKKLAPRGGGARMFSGLLRCAKSTRPRNRYTIAETHPLKLWLSHCPPRRQC